MERGLAQRDVARQLGVSPRRISSLEGAAFVPASTAERYFNALGRLGAKSYVHEPRPSERTVRLAALRLSPQSNDPAQASAAELDRRPRGSTGA